MISTVNRINNKGLISTDFADFIKLEDDIILLRFKRSGELEMHEAIEIIKITKELSENNFHSLIYDFNKCSVYFTQEVRALAQNRNSSIDQIYARAFICYNLSNKLEVNHFIKYNKPQTPTALFTSYEKSIEWALDQKKEWKGRH